MAISIFSLMGSIFVDSSAAEESISKTEEKSNKLSDSFMTGISNAGKWAAGLATAAGSAAVAIGAAAINVSTDVDKAMGDFAASTGVASDELEAYEDAMMNIYNNNFGESFEDIAASMGQIKQVMGEGMGAEALETMTQNALMLRDTFEFDVTESVRAANALMDQFGISGEDAYNLIAQGAQNGLNQNGDMLDVLNEYAVHFSQLGMDAEGMFNMLASGAESGTFSVDKLGDAMKEFGIRTKDGSEGTAKAFEALGYDADTLFETFNKGGKDAADMTQILIDELASMPDGVEKTTAGVALFGTMWEDLGAEGITALSNIDGGISTTKDALAGINDVKYDNLASMFEGLKRNAETLLLPLGNALIPLIMEFVQIVQDNMPIVEKVISDITPIIMELFSTLLPPIMDLIQNLLPVVADLINMLLPPIMDLIQNLLPVVVDLINMLLPPIMQIIEMILPILIQLLEPIQSILPLIAELLMPIIEACMTLITPLVELLDIVLPPLIDIITFLVEVTLFKMRTGFETMAGIIKNVVNVAVSYVQNQIAILKNIFSNIIDFIRNVFTGDWKAAFENVKNILSNIFQGMVNVVKTPVNVIIGIINGLISGVTSGINSVIRVLNGLSIDVPDWVTEKTGISDFGFNIPTVSAPQIPLLAKGGNAIEEGSAIVGENGAELIDLPAGAKVTPLTQNNDPIGYKAMTEKLDTMIYLLGAILEKEGSFRIGETEFTNYINRSLGALI